MSTSTSDWPLTDEEYDRYSRQIIVPGMGLEAQLNLKSAKVLLIGAGGLGCAAALYLAGSGIGTIGIVDGDTVEASNLHRQIGHATSRIGIKKTLSLIFQLRDLNPLPVYTPHTTALTSRNAEDVIRPYDLVLDCTDNPGARYLISDMCVLLGKPVVSAAAVRCAGNLIVLNCPPAPQGEQGSPCYRCCFGPPPPRQQVQTCGEAGILGPVVGMLGVMQAGEAVKILARGVHRERHGQTPNGHQPQPSLLLHTLDLSSFISSRDFRVARMRARRRDCPSCGIDSPKNLTLERVRSGELDTLQHYDQYQETCPSEDFVPKPLDARHRVSAAQYRDAEQKGELPVKRLLVDIRSREHFSTGAIEGAVNVPYEELVRADLKAGCGSDRVAGAGQGMNRAARARQTTPLELILEPPDAAVYLVCRTGFDSQDAAHRIMEAFPERTVVDIKGGMRAWTRDVDPKFPFI